MEFCGVSLLPEGQRNVGFRAKETVLPHSSRGGRRKAAPYRSDILDLVSGHTYRRQRKELTRPFPINSA